MNRFTYWKRGKNLTKSKIKKIPSGGTEKLIYYKILNGEFDESPYWKMALEHEQTFKNEKVQWKTDNKGTSKEAYQEWEMNRRKTWNKQIFKLKESHYENEIKLLRKLEQELNNAFGFSHSPVDFETFEGSMVELYEEYKRINLIN